MKVLAAVDFGDPSLEALSQARALAHELGATLAVCHVMPTMHELSLLFPTQSLSLDADLVAQAERTGEALKQHARDKLGLELDEVYVDRGSAYAEIVRRAEAIGASYIVIGTHGHRGLARAFLGSVAERVVEHAHCSVLIARTPTKRGVVLAATDLSTASVPVVSEGVAAARRLGARLVVASAIEWDNPLAVSIAGMVGVLSPLPPPELQAQVRQNLHTALEGALARAGATGEAQVLEGPPAWAIVNAADELAAELVVVGAHGHTGLLRLPLGSVAGRVVRTASSSVLVVRAPR